VAFHAKTTRAYADAAIAAGARIREGVRVDRLVVRDGKVVAVATAQGEEIPVPGRLFILANSGVRSLVAPWLDLPTWNLALQVLVSKPLAHNPVRHLVGHASRTLSLKREPDGRLIISGGRLGRWNFETGRGTPIPEEIAANVADAVAVYRHWSDWRFLGGDNGRRSLLGCRCGRLRWGARHVRRILRAVVESKDHGRANHERAHTDARAAPPTRLLRRLPGEHSREDQSDHQDERREQDKDAAKRSHETPHILKPVSTRSAEFEIRPISTLPNLISWSTDDLKFKFGSWPMT
jgi:hypothetical protein